MRSRSERRTHQFSFALCIASLVLLSSCGTASSPVSSSTSSAPVSPVVPVARLLPTTIETTTVTDPSRPLVSNGVQLAPARTLPVGIERPKGPGRFPLVVFAPGYDTSPLTYGRLTHVLAQHGYVVAAPSFPLEDPARGNGLDREDLPNEAQDLRVVLAYLLTSSLQTHIDQTHIAFVGHSDGADAVLQAAFEQGHTNPKIDAVIALSPDALSFTPTTGGPPAAIVHGTNDEIVDPAAASQVVRALADQRFDITINGADHASSVIGTTPLTATIDGVILAALNDLETAPDHLIGDVATFSAVSIREAGAEVQ